MGSLEEKRLAISKNRAALGVATLPRSNDLANDRETVNFYKEKLAAWARGPEGSAFLRGKIGKEQSKQLIAALEQKDGVYDDKRTEIDMRRAIGLFQESKGNLRVDETIGFRTKFALETATLTARRDDLPAPRRRSVPSPESEERKPAKAEMPTAPVVDATKAEFDLYLKSVPQGNPFVQQARYQGERRELSPDDRKWWKLKISEYEQVRSTVEAAHRDNPVVKDLMERIQTATPLTETERNTFRSNIEGYNQIGHYHENLARLDPSYRSGSDAAVNYFAGWSDRRRFQVSVASNGKGGVDHVSLRKLGGDEPVVTLRSERNYDKHERLGSGGVAKWAWNRHLHSEIVIRVSPSMLTANGGTRSDAQWLTDVLRHERAHFYGGGESQARDAEHRFRGKIPSAKFEEVIASSLYSRTVKAQTIAEHYIDRGTAIVHQRGRTVPNPELVSWLGGANYRAFVGGRESSGERRSSDAQAAPRRSDTAVNRSGFTKSFNPSDPEVRDGIIRAFVAKAVDPVADRYREIPNMTGTARYAAQARYYSEVFAAEAQGRKAAEQFLKLLDARR